ncbi:MAG: response regulator transcription factor [Bulleidia sp.]|nr:response regulator transcription factor [Bulleidia sp.]
MNEKALILIAEDDPDIVALLKLYLEKEGYGVLSAADGREALDLVNENNVDLGIFDIMMPNMDGFELIHKVRESHGFPILVLSARGQDEDKIKGLNLGADDYLSKPFNPLEVVARVKAMLRRYHQLNPQKDEAEEEVYRTGDLELNMTTMTLTKKGQEIALTPMEMKILALLMKKPGHVYTKIQIFEQINGTYLDGDDRTLMVHISNLRDKIEDDSRNPVYLKTIRGLGYKVEKL